MFWYYQYAVCGRQCPLPSAVPGGQALPPLTQTEGRVGWLPPHAFDSWLFSAEGAGFFCIPAPGSNWTDHSSPVQLFADGGSGWLHSALRYHQLMMISCHFQDCKVLVVTSLTCVRNAVATRKYRTFTFLSVIVQVTNVHCFPQML